MDKSRIGVKKGDAVTNGQVVVLLDDAEYKARFLTPELSAKLDFLTRN